MKGRRLFIDQVMACCIYPVTCNSKPDGMDAPGVTIRQSKYPVKQTIDRIESFLLQHGATIYARVNQEGAVINSSRFLFPLEILFFGSLVRVAPLMALNPLSALDLPLKVIAWEDGRRRNWVAYNDCDYIRNRYSIPGCHGSALHLDHLIEPVLR